jgi:hypothetical protein
LQREDVSTEHPVSIDGFKELGRALSDWLIPNPPETDTSPRALLQRTLTHSAASALAGSPDVVVRISLRLEPLTAHEYPWEAILCESLEPGPAWLALHPRLSLVRFVPAPFPARLPPRTGLLRLLLAHSEAPGGLAALDYRSIWRSIRDALRPGIEADRIQIVERPQLTRASLEKALDEVKPHVVDLTAHGGPKAVYLQGEPLQPDDLAKLFWGSSARLVVLDVCHSLRSGHALAAAGVPAVVAMLGAPSDQFADRFASAFYATLGQGRSVDEAMSRARDSVAPPRGEAFAPRWCRPVLFSRLADGLL